MIYAKLRLPKYHNAQLIMLDPWVLISMVDDAKLLSRKFGFAFGIAMETNVKGIDTICCTLMFQCDIMTP